MKEVVDISNASFSLGFGGENEIDLKDLISSLDGTVELLDYVAKSLDKDSYIKINVKGSRKGSFIIDFGIIAKEVCNLLTVENVAFASVCLDSFCKIIEVKKHLKGDKPKTVSPDGKGNVIIENVDSEKLHIENHVYNLYGDYSDKALKRIFSNCNRDSVYIESDGAKRVEIPKDMFPLMEKEICIDRDDSAINITNSSAEIIIGIKKADFYGSSQWEIAYNGKILKASVNDKKFIEDLHEGDVSITSKTTMKVELRSELSINEIGEVVKTSYSIEKILDIYTNKTEHVQLKI